MENKEFIMARAIAEAVGRLGGRTFFVGGYVRDRIMDGQRSEEPAGTTENIIMNWW